MPRLILKCPYVKCGSKGNSGGISRLINYIAKRDGVEKIREENKKLLPTQPQEKLIEKVLKEFPNCKNTFAYEAYVNEKNIGTASEFLTIAIDENYIKMKKMDGYIDYISKRPRVEKISSHGLFSSSNETIDLSMVVKEMKNHEGNVWTPIISLKREDAVNTGFDTANTWKELLSRMEITFAEKMKIAPENFRWYGAFHDEGHHPHVHMVCYSINPKEGYLSEKGIEKIKSELMNNIFKQELTEIYTEKSKRRDYLRTEGKEVLKTLIKEIQVAPISNEKFEVLFLALVEELKNTKGKKVYGYLNPKAKNIVNALIDELEKEEPISKAYEFWREMKNEVIKSYKDTEAERIPLSMETAFKPLKNAVIQEARKFQMEAEQNIINETSLEFHTNQVLKHLGKIFEEQLPTDNEQDRRKMDSKLLQKMREKKLALGQKQNSQQRL